VSFAERSSQYAEPSYRNESLGIEILTPTDFVLELGSSPDIFAIIRAKSGLLPQMNLVRTKLYGRSGSGDDWSRIVDEDYKRIGIADVEILKKRVLQIKSNYNDSVSVPAVDISYSRGGEQMWSTVARLSLYESDIVITIKSNSPEIIGNRGAAQDLINSLTVDSKKLILDSSSGISGFMSYLLLLIVAVFISYRCYRGLKGNKSGAICS